MSMTQTQMETNIRLLLADGSTFWSDAELDYAITRAEFFLARALPKKNVVETTISINEEDEELTISSSAGTTSYKPVKYDSETITSADGGTTYVRDTNYTINYMTGAITEITGMDDGSYLITYKRDPMRLDISSLVSNPIAVTRIEYPAGQQPPTYLANFDWIEDFIIFHGDDVLTEERHIRIYYNSMWTAATADAAGEYPGHLADVVITGACGFALLMKAEKYLQSAITEVGLVNSAADSMATPLSDINTALDKIATHITAAGTAADKISTYLETNDTTDCAKDVLANITDDIANLRTAIQTAQAAANTYLDEVDTTDLGQATYGAEALLKVPVDSSLINKLTVGERVPQTYKELSTGWVTIATARLNAALAFVEEANSRIANIRTYVEEAMGWVTIANGFRDETVQRIAMANAFVSEATQRVAEVYAWATQADRYMSTYEAYMNIAGRYLASGQSKVNEFFVMIGIKPEVQHTRGASSQPTQY